MENLAQIPAIRDKIKTAPRAAILALHKLIFQEEGGRTNRSRLREFTGFEFNDDSDEFRAKMEFCNSFTVGDLTSICNILGLNYEGSKEELRRKIICALMDINSLVNHEDTDGAESDEEHDDNQNNAPARQSSSNEESDMTQRSVVQRNDAPLNRDMMKFPVNFKDVEDSIRFFDGSDNYAVERWINDFEEIAALYEWNEMQKLIFAKKMLKGLAKTFVLSEGIIKTWQKLKNALTEEFSSRVTSVELHHMLSERRIGRNETVQEYYLAMKELATKGTIETESVIQHIINGINDDDGNKQMLYGAKNYADFKDRLRNYEKFKKTTQLRKAAKNKDSTRWEDSSKKFVKEQSSTKPVTKDVRCYSCGEFGHRSNTCKQDVKRCFNCGSKGHVSTACPAKDKGVKCFECNEHGHIAAKCTKRASTGNKSCNAMQVSSKGCCKNVIINGVEAIALIDTGSDISLMRADFYVKIGAPALVDQPIKFRGIGSDENFTLGKTNVRLPIDDCDFNIVFHVVPDAFIKQPLLIGTDFLRGIELSVKGDDVSIRKVRNDTLVLPEVNKIEIIDRNKEVDVIHIPDSEIRDELREVISNYKPSKEKDVGVKLTIVLKDDVPVYQRARRLAVSEQKEVNSQIQTWLEEKIIQPSVSDYASPIVLVKKKCGATRICVDYRRLNEKIVKVRYPLPIIDDQIDRLRGARVFSTIDLKNGFFHVPVVEDSRKYTAFIVPSGHYEFLKMPFGLCTSPAYFQKYINAVFSDLAAKGIVSIYMDDLIVPSTDFREGLVRLKMVLDVAAKHGLAINWNKCQFLQTRVNYLGYVIQDGNVTPSDEKTNAVKHFPVPTNVKSVQSFLGLTGYFRKFIPKYATIANPLTNLLKDDVKFCFGESELHAFTRLKEALSARPVLRIYSPSAETELHTDASSQGYGAILLQRDSEDRLFHPIYFASGKTTDSEAKFHSYELEVLAIIKALNKFRTYLIGIPFTIVTDCQAFALTMRKANCCTRVARWAIFLQDFHYKVEHRPGKHMQHVDALSRNSLPMSMLVDECENGMLARLKKNQMDDDALLKIRKLVEDGQEEGYVIKNDLLCKVIDGDTPVVVPKLMQASLIRRIHERGHFAADKTEKLLRSDYWFKGLRAKIEKILKNCVDCILGERKIGKQEGWLHSIDKGEAPFDTYHVDHLGPLPSTKKRYGHIFAVVDAFTKFVWLYPTRSTSTAEVIDCLLKQSAVFGNPRRIISDQGTAFTSREFEAYCKDECIEHTKIVTGVPRGNGQIERVNRTLIPMLTKLSAPNPAEWHKYVGRAQSYINNSHSRSTGMSPFYLLFGTKMKIKEDPEFRELLEREEAIIFQEKRDSIREQAKEAISRIQAENKRSYNKKRKAPSHYKEGQLVAIKRTQGGPGLKCAAKFLGPYRITRALRNDRYVVEKVGQGEGPRVTSTADDFMKPWCDDHEELSSEEDT